MCSSELRFARWNEIDWQQKLWIIPEEREQIENVRFSHRGTKMKTQHIVPLSEQAIAILKQIEALSGHLSFIFLGEYDQDKCMSDNTINKALRVMGYYTKKEICDHGFRAMACSALSESGPWSKEAIEKQMSHQERNSVRAAPIFIRLNIWRNGSVRCSGGRIIWMQTWICMCRLTSTQAT